MRIHSQIMEVKQTIRYNMNKKITVSIGIIVWIITPLLVSNIFDINLMQLLKSFFSIIHLFVLIFVICFDYQSKHKLQKTLLLVAFLDYPFLMTVDSTQMFGEKTYIVVFIAAWIYVMGLTGWLYIEKRKY